MADLKTLNGHVGSLGNESRSISTGPVVVGGVGHIEFDPGTSILAAAAHWDRAGAASATTLRVLLKGNVLGSTWRKRERDSGVTEPSVDTTIGSNLVPADARPVIGVGVVKGEGGSVVVAVNEIRGDQELVASVVAAAGTGTSIGDLFSGGTLGT